MGASTFSYNHNNPAAPAGKTDFGAKGPNPIQFNQFMAQPTAPKESSNSASSSSASSLSASSLDLLMASLLSSTITKTTTPAPTTTSPPPIRVNVMASERLNDFVLGPKTEYRSNKFAEIPTNTGRYDAVNPFASFMGETLPPPTTTTPAPPGRNGDFLAGFIGSHLETPEQVAAKAQHQPNIYMYNYQHQQAAKKRTTKKPAAKPTASGAELALQSMDSGALSSVVQKLLGALASKQG